MRSTGNSSMLLYMTSALSDLSVLMDEDTQKYYFQLQGQHELYWDDPRLADIASNPCRAVFETMLSITAAEARVPATVVSKQAQADLFWLPKIDPSDQLDPLVLLSRDFSLSSPARVTEKLMQRYWIGQELDRFFYPFDKQTLKFAIPLPLSRPSTEVSQNAGADARVTLAGCGVDEDFVKLDAMPTASPWFVNGPIRSSAVDGVCTISIPIKHVPTSYVWQTLLPTTVVSIGSIFTITLDAKNPDTAAARSSVLLVAMLLLVESNAQIFKQTYTMWTDLLAMMQVALLTCGLLETWIVYWVAIRRPHLSDAIDAVMFYVFPLFYALMVTSMVLYAQGEDTLALILVVIGLYLLVHLSTARVLRMMLRRRQRLEGILISLRTFDPGQAKSKAALKNAFAHFDVDHSGSIDGHELLEMISSLYPHLSHEEKNELVESKGWDLDFEGGITMDELQECIVEWNEVLVEVDVESRSSRRASSGVFGNVAHQVADGLGMQRRKSVQLVKKGNLTQRATNTQAAIAAKGMDAIAAASAAPKEIMKMTTDQVEAVKGAVTGAVTGVERRVSTGAVAVTGAVECAVGPASKAVTCIGATCSTVRTSMSRMPDFAARRPSSLTPAPPAALPPPQKDQGEALEVQARVASSGPSAQVTTTAVWR